MDTCPNCGRQLPEELLSPIWTGDGSVGVICGVCALKLSNRALGLSRTSFKGEVAESMRLAAMEHYKKTNQL